MNTCEASSLEEWRAWLDRHHESQREVWLIFFKQHTGRRGVSYEDALDEALCFGWVDSLIERLDEDRYARKFTPRKANSRWSDINRKLYEKLRKAGRLKPSGVERAPTDRGYDARPSMPSRVPPYISAGLKKNARAWRAFQALPLSHRRQYVGWIHMAKQDATKARRMREAVRLLALGKPLGLK